MMELPIDSDVTTANSTIVVRDDRTAVVELHPDHPGFSDSAYRQRRNVIAQMALDYESGQPLPDAPYTPEEHDVWYKVWQELGPMHEAHACREYREAVSRMDFDKRHIPQIAEVSRTIESNTGFRLEPIAGLIEASVFLSQLGNKIFLSTQYIRHYSTPLYTPEPDVVHELVGHAGMLTEPRFAEINRLVGEAAMRTKSPERLEKLGRVYWFTIEFGVCREDGALKAYGAGLLSSFGELEAMHKADLQPFDFDAMMSQEYDVTMYQPTLFCADSFEDAYSSLSKFLREWPAD